MMKSCWSNFQGFGFELSRAGDSQTQVGSISGRSQKHETSLFGEVMKELVCRFVSDGQIFLIQTTENMPILGALLASALLFMFYLTLAALPVAFFIWVVSLILKALGVF